MMYLKFFSSVISNTWFIFSLSQFFLIIGDPDRGNSIADKISEALASDIKRSTPSNKVSPSNRDHFYSSPMWSQNNKPATCPAAPLDVIINMPMIENICPIVGK